MREVITVCRSGKKSRIRTARVLDRYFWRIGDRTWRGKASNACLDRVARELRNQATRNTAVTIHEIRSAHESRKPIIRIGSKAAFSEEGHAPVASHPSRFSGKASARDACLEAIVRISALFHDLGKATLLFQDKLRRSLSPKKDTDGQSDPIRHELHSAVVWDLLFGDTANAHLASALADVTPEAIDTACKAAIPVLAGMHAENDVSMNLRFLKNDGRLASIIGMLILTHHKLPEGGNDHLTLCLGRHVNHDIALARSSLAIAPGTPFWHEAWWLSALRREAGSLQDDVDVSSVDIAIRASLMFGDHLGSSQKKPSSVIPDHLANTMNDPEKGSGNLPADSLSTHVLRVYKRARGAFAMLHRYRDRFPAILEGQIPVDIMYPVPSENPRYRWQSEAALAARALAEKNEGGFFACILSGTGTGKTRGAPTILANAAIGDMRPERRYFRMSLALGLRVLATQSAREYVDDLGFRDEDVSVLVGEEPLQFEEEIRHDGSESQITIPEWLRVEAVNGAVPGYQGAGEEDWLRSLSIDTDRAVPAFFDMIIETAGKHAGAGRRLVAPPVMVGTIDHLMSVAAPVSSRFLIPALRVLTSDLVIDEIDQFEGEDIAAIGRLVFQAGAGGRRVIIMSATLTPDIAHALHESYARGWREYAASNGISERVNILCTGDAPGSTFSNEDGLDFHTLMSRSITAIVENLEKSPALRRAEILQPCNEWDAIVSQVNESCSRLHGANATVIDGFNVSIGMVRMTRIAHTAALAAQLPSGKMGKRMRVKLCLHARFPRLHRGWIEARLKRALTRKGSDPDKGLRDLCIRERVFDRARACDVTDIEIVVVTSPVIETGNDFDFDYAILDPVSMRSIIQSAGRVWRHRPGSGMHVNVLILGRSPIVMQNGRLAMPGVETKPADDTGVSRRSLDVFEGRCFRDISGDEDFSTVTAACLLSGDGDVPLRDEEAFLRQEMIDPENGPLSKYIRHLCARMNMRMTRSRRFRRSETGQILYTMIGNGIDEAVWHHDLAPGTRESVLRPSHENGLTICGDQDFGDILFRDVTRSAWTDYSGGYDEMRQSDLKHLMKMQMPNYSHDIIQKMTYCDFTGFTRGFPEDLFSTFGKTEQNQ